MLPASLTMLDPSIPIPTPIPTPAHAKPPVTNTHPSSPLNPTSSLAIPSLRRASTRGLYGHRKSLTPNNTPDRFTPRTPLTYLSNSPSGTSNSSYASSIGWHLQTPTAPAHAGVHFADPSPHELPPPATFAPRKSSAPSLGYQMHIKIPSCNSSDSSTTSGSPGDTSFNAPSPLDKMDHLCSIPPSPPIVMPSAQLLELPPNFHPDAHCQHSIASPFVNLNSSASPMSAKPGPVSAISPLVTTHRRGRNFWRRGSNLAHEMNAIDLNDTYDPDESKYDADADTDDGHDALVPSPTRTDHSSPHAA